LLLRTNASLHQYPYWNEPLRRLHFKPRYLVWGTPDRPRAYVCILTLGFRGARIGLVFRGPTNLQSEEELPAESLRELVCWARQVGYIFIRFTHSDGGLLRQVAALGIARDFDAFPYYLDFSTTSPDFVVEQKASDGEMLADFDHEARRKIRRGLEMGYEFRSSDTPEALADMWPLYQECARRKGFRMERPFSVYMELVRQARPHNCARVYSAHLNGKPVGTTLVFRDHQTALCLLAAFDPAPGQCSAASLLHWWSMRDMHRLGARCYNMGPGPGSLARFKEQFSPQHLAYPGPVTVVLRDRLFGLWCNAVLPVAKLSRPTLRAVSGHLYR
jgi:hypothetical protein